MGKRKKKKTHVEADPEADAKVPRSIVFKSGKVGRSIAHLVHDMRKMMLPYTAERLQESKKNRLKDFLDVASVLGVTHMLSFSQSEVATNMRVLRCPRGPTLTFRVLSYSLMSDVVALQRRPHAHGAEFRSPPLVVLNNFGGKENHKQLMAVMFQNMFPPINMQTIKLSECRRVVLFTLNSETEEIEMRHYVINASPVGLTRSIKKIVKAKIPDLHRFADISEYVLGANDGLSDSEVEDAPESRVTLPQDFAGRGNKKSHKSALRLQELGPRLRLKLLKIEEQVCDGRVLYHAFVEKTPEEAERLQQIKAAKVAEKERRRKEQEANLDKKKKKSRRQRPVDGDDDGGDGGSDQDQDDDDDDGDDEEDDGHAADAESSDGNGSDSDSDADDDDADNADVDHDDDDDALDDEFPSDDGDDDEASDSDDERSANGKRRKVAATSTSGGGGGKKSAAPAATAAAAGKKPQAAGGFAFVKKGGAKKK